ncbi:ABC transporter ATP-binding protein [Sphingobium phenoxybenzoativorans]|uniref:ABC transporter ATP-binding protein n=1 Tax=Sphingobium phenoxybenzoativorans TaxID=1592790 RepID=A0A975K3V5_9SPHN|nr:ABC transporter ATP-binding protein [Sphingobium phenoxybenzoativorans]QUT04373.1 ABC transporter ATP-binding protein [Sphingobium phenoxybenzoativorans]
MIKLTGISKYYEVMGGRRAVLDNISLSISPGEHVGVLGRNGAGKSTLVRIIGGAEQPSSGQVERGMTVSWPLAFTGGFQPSLTGADNLRFICRIYDVDYAQRVAFVQDFSELGPYLYEPVGIYSSGMRARLAFAISMTIDFDCYLIDEVIAVGDESFRQKCRVELFEKRADKAMIVVSHSHRYLKGTCSRFLLLRDSKVEEYTDFDEAYMQYKMMLEGQDAAASATTTQ